MTFFFVTGNQKTIPGFIPGVTLPMIRDGAETGGWQLNLVNAAAFLPSPLTCQGGVEPFPGFCLGAAAVAAKSIMTTGLYPQVYLAGDCPPACTVGAGGLARDDHKLPYAHQASVEINHQAGRGLMIGAGYLYVGANRLVLGNGLNIPCPQGTSKPQNPSFAQGWVNPDGSLSDCAGNATAAGREACVHGWPRIPQRRISRLQQRRRPREVPRHDAAGVAAVRRHVPPGCQLHLVAHHRQRELHDVHQPAAEPVRQRIGGSRFEPGCPPPVRREFQRARAREQRAAELRSERHRHRAVRAPLHHLRRRRCQRRHQPGDRSRRALAEEFVYRRPAAFCRFTGVAPLPVAEWPEARP